MSEQNLTFLRKSLGLLLAFLLILQSLPSHALTRPPQTTLNSPAEKAYSITEGFFDGSPRTRPSLAETSPVRAPLLLAYNESAINQACRGVGRGPNCVAPIKLKDPKQPVSPTRTEDPPACDPSIQECSYEKQAQRQQWWQNNWINPMAESWKTAASLPSSDTESLINIGKSFKYLFLGALWGLLGFIPGIPFVLAGAITMTASAISLAVSSIKGVVQGLLDALSFGKVQSDKDKTFKKDPLYKLTYKIAQISLFLALLPITLPVYLYQEYTKPENKLKRLEGEQKRLLKSRSGLQSKQKGLQAELHRLLTEGHHRKQTTQATKTKEEEPLPEVVKIDVPAYENPAEGITQPIRRTEDIEKEQSPKPSLEEQINTVDKENAALEEEMGNLQQDILSLNKRIRFLKNYERLDVLYEKEAINATVDETCDTEGLCKQNTQKSHPDYPDDRQTLNKLIKEEAFKIPLAFSLWLSQKLFKENKGEPTTTSGFLEKRQSSFHKGLDIKAKRGALIVSSIEARVVFAGYYHANTGKTDPTTEERQKADNAHSLGNLVVLAPTDSNTRLDVYQHLGEKKVAFHKGKAKTIDGKSDSPILGTDKEGSGILVKENQVIQPGEPIGAVGNTGRVQSQAHHRGQEIGSHLHWGVIEVDPQVNERMAALRENKATAPLYQKIRAAYFKAMGYKYNPKDDTYEEKNNPRSEPDLIKNFLSLANAGKYSATFINPWLGREKSDTRGKNP